MKFIGKDLWVAFFVTIVILSFALCIALSYLLPLSLSLIASISFFVVVIIYALWRGYQEIKKNETGIVEIYGKYYGRPIEEGVYWLFPFGFVKGRELFTKDTQSEDLFCDNEDDKVDFRGGIAAKVKAMYHYRIVDPEKAFYEVDNYRVMTKSRIDAALRAYLNKRSFEECNSEKSKITIDAVCVEYGVDLVSVIESGWGIRVLDLMILDVELSEEDIALRRRVMNADIEADIAQKEVARSLALAEGQKKALKLEGEGLADKVEAMIKKGVEKDQIMAYLAEKLKWENIGDKTVIIDDGNGLAGVLAKLKAIGL